MVRTFAKVALSAAVAGLSATAFGQGDFCKCSNHCCGLPWVGSAIFLIDTVLFLRGFDRVSLFVSYDIATPCGFHKGMVYPSLALICASSNSVKPATEGFPLPRINLFN